MLLISQNLLNYDMDFPDDTVLRINMAWVKDLNTLRNILAKFDKDVFLDLPTGRKKPPNYRYKMAELKEIIEQYPIIKYLAISNVELVSQIEDAYKFVPESITLVPKIESINGIKNIDKLSKALREKKQFMMLDHDDLFSNIISENKSVEYYVELIENLISYCQSNEIMLLRTRGVIFSEEI